MWKMLLGAAATLLCAACDNLPSRTGETSPAAVCANPDVHRAVLRVIAENVFPNGAPGGQQIELDKTFRLERPTVDEVDHDTGAISCSIDLIGKTGNLSALIDPPAGLDRVARSEPAVRLRFVQKRQADTGTPLYEVQQLPLVAEFAAMVNFTGARSEQTRAVEAPQPAPTPRAIELLIARTEDENGACRGGSGGEEATMRACNRRQALMKQLQDAGWCWGGAEIEADKRFIRCRPGDGEYSPGAFDEPYFSEQEILETVSQGGNEADAVQ